jgi:hypothetical protein
MPTNKTPATIQTRRAALLSTNIASSQFARLSPRNMNLHFEFAVAKLLDTSDRFQRKKEVAQLLHEAGFSKSFVRETLVFCERILKLPREYDDPFKLHLEELEGKMGREYVPTWERQARCLARNECGLL